MQKHKKKEIIIFCSAPGDIKPTLELLEIYKTKYTVNIVVTSSLNNYLFIKEKVSRDVTIIFNKTLPLRVRDLIKPLIIRYKLNILFKSHFKQKTIYKAYIFCLQYDYSKLYFLSRIKLTHGICFIDNYSFGIKEKYIYKNFLKNFLITQFYNILLGVPCNIVEPISSPSEIVLQLPIEKFQIKIITLEKINSTLPSRYFFNPKGNNDILLILDKDTTDMMVSSIIDYDRGLKLLIRKLLNTNKTIYVKNHPNYVRNIIDSELGMEKSLKILPNEIPIELINLYSYKIIFGIISISLANATIMNDNIFSLLDLLPFRDNSFYKNYLKKNSDNKVKFIKNMDEFDKVLSKCVA